MWYIELTSKKINTNTTDCSKDAKTIFIYYFLAFLVFVNFRSRISEKF